MYCPHKSGEVCTQFQLYILLRLVQSTSVTVQRANLMKSQLYTYLGSEGLVVLPLSVTEFEGLCTQFEEKQLCTLVAQYGLQTLYVKLAKGCLIPPSSVTEFNEDCTQFQEKPASSIHLQDLRNTPSRICTQF